MTVQLELVIFTAEELLQTPAPMRPMSTSLEMGFRGRGHTSASGTRKPTAQFRSCRPIPKYFVPISVYVWADRVKHLPEA